MDAIPTLLRVLAVRHHRAMDRRHVRLQAFLQGVHHGLGFCRGQDERPTFTAAPDPQFLRGENAVAQGGGTLQGAEASERRVRRVGA